MANDNKNINQLVHESDDDPTTELEALKLAQSKFADSEDELPPGEDTFDFEKFEGLDELAGKSIAALKSDIRSRNASIGRLQYDIEQLRARWTGFEREIEAREEQTARLNDELNAAQELLVERAELLQQRDEKIVELQSIVDERQSRLDEMEAEAVNISDALDSGKSVIEELQQKVDEQRHVISELNRSADDAGKSSDEKDASIKTLEADLDRLNQELADAKSARKSTAREQKDLAGQVRKLEKELRSSEIKHEKLLATAERDSSAIEDDYRQQLSLQDGLLSSAEKQVDELKAQLTRTEAYADGLRVQVQDAAELTDRAVKKRQQMEATLSAAEANIAELESGLVTEREAVEQLNAQLEQNQNEFAEEVRTIRFELGSAQETIADQETMNEQLASDLIDNQSFRHALEEQLAAAETKSAEKIKKLERKLKQTKQDKDDIERKVADKDNAIAALLNELASRSRTIDSIGEIENVIHEIDGRMSDRIEEKPEPEKDRMARLLIGNVDGQELQFPLFKDRLTIGRTEHNDIQLKAQYISRRHALIVTENGQSRIVDWGSKNGVYVNDSRVAEQVLKNGDVVAIGAAEFRYEERPKR